MAHSQNRPLYRQRCNPFPGGLRLLRLRLPVSGAVAQLCCSTGEPHSCRIVRVSSYRGYATLQGRGTIALPAELRRKYRLDEPGAQLEITERADGVIELRPTLPVPVEEMWFWTPGRQAAEQEVEDDLAAGRYRDFDDAESFLADLEGLVEAGRDETGE